VLSHFAQLVQAALAISVWQEGHHGTNDGVALRHDVCKVVIDTLTKENVSVVGFELAAFFEQRERA